MRISGRAAATAQSHADQVIAACETYKAQHGGALIHSLPFQIDPLPTGPTVAAARGGTGGEFMIARNSNRRYLNPVKIGVVT